MIMIMIKSEKENKARRKENDFNDLQGRKPYGISPMFSSSSLPQSRVQIPTSKISFKNATPR